MTEFMMIFRNEYTPEFVPTPEQMQESVKQWADWMGGIAAQGKFSSTNRLSSAGTKIIRPNQVVTDGPFAELKEIVGGYLVVQTETIDEAMAMAMSCPIYAIGGNVEIRQVIPMTM